MPSLSIIIPTLNEALFIDETLSKLKPFIDDGHEIIVCDAGSSDQTISICKQYTQKVFLSDKGRAKQMNLGAQHAENEVLVFLHADTLLPVNAALEINQAIENGKQWGHFNIKLSGADFSLRVIEYFMNFRSCVTGIATGDQVIFVIKKLFKSINGFKDISLMEDIEISKSLKKISPPACLQSRVVSSSRRWETQGIVKTVLFMWSIRLLYFFGVPATRLVKFYYK